MHEDNGQPPQGDLKPEPEQIDSGVVREALRKFFSKDEQEMRRVQKAIRSFTLAPNEIILIKDLPWRVHSVGMKMVVLEALPGVKMFDVKKKK